MPELLLLSNSTSPGGAFLEHALAEIASLVPARSSLLFVPFAGRDHDGYTARMAAALTPAGIRVTGAHAAADPVAAIEAADAIFVGGGNSFRLLRALQHRNLLPAIVRRIAGGMPYLGASAGSNLACPTIRTTNDMPIVAPDSLDALGLIPVQINPHYVDPDPASTHQGETRPQRITEFLDENDVPVIGLREGSWLRMSGARARLGGTAGAVVFERDAAARQLAPGTDVSWLLDVTPGFDQPRRG